MSVPPPHGQPPRPPQQGYQPGYPPPGYPAYPSPGAWAGPQAGPQAGPPAGPPHVTQRGRGGGLPLVLGLVLGLLVGAGVMTTLALTGVVGRVGADGAGSADTTPIALPSSLPGLVLQVDAIRQTGNDKGQATIDGLTQTRDRTLPALSAAFGGAAVDIQFYSSTDLYSMTTVQAARAPSPGITLRAVTDAAYLGLAVAPETVQRVGDVECLVSSIRSVPAGQQVEPEDSFPGYCQRTGAALTVRVYSGTDTVLDQAVAVTNAAWTALAS